MKTILTIMALLAACSLQAAAPTLGAGWVTATASSSISAITLSFTVTNNSNRCLVAVYQTGGTAVGQTISAMTYGGVGMTKGITATSRNGGGTVFNRAEIWYLKAPANGTANIVATMVGATGADSVTLGGGELDGVDQSLMGAQGWIDGSLASLNFDMTTLYDNSTVVGPAQSTRALSADTSWNLFGSTTQAWAFSSLKTWFGGAYVLDASTAGSKAYDVSFSGGSSTITDLRVGLEFPPVQPTPTPTITPTATPTLTVTKTATPSVTPTFTPTATRTATPSASPTVTLTKTPTASPTATPTMTKTVTRTSTPTVSPTTTPTATMVCGLIGNPTPESFGYYGFPMISGNKYTIPQASIISSFSVYLKSAGSTIQMGLYTNLSGRASTLAIQSLTVTAQMGWNTLNCGHSYLAAGDYWLVMQASDLDARVWGKQGTDMFIQRNPSISGAFPAIINGIVYRNKYQFSAYMDACH